MQYVPINSLRVSRLCLGCWNISGDATWGPQDRKTTLATFGAALDAGVNFFDTAPMYGNGFSEELLGEFLRPLRAGTVVATKTTQLRRDPMIRSCEDSLRRLRTDCIDLFYLHWPDWECPPDETAAALLDLRRQGKIREIAVSNYGVRDLEDLLPHLRPAVNQMSYSLLWRAVEFEILPLCRRESIGLAPYSPLAEGLLAGRFHTADDVPEGRARTRLFSGQRPQARHGEAGAEKETFDAIAAIRQLAGKRKLPMADLALAWLMAQPGVPFVVAGARTPEQMRQNARAAEMTLDAPDCTALGDITDKLKQRLGSNPDMWQSRSRIR